MSVASVGARVDRREQRALHERHGEREVQVRVGREARDASSRRRPAGVHRQQEQREDDASGRSAPAGAACAGPSAARRSRPGAASALTPPRPRPCSLSSVGARALERAPGLGQEDVVERRARAAAGSRTRCPRRRARARRLARSSAPSSSRTATRLRAARRRLAEARQHRRERARAPPGRRARPRPSGAPISAFSAVRRALGDDLPAVDDADAVGEHVGLLQVLRREEDRDAVVGARRADLVPQRACGSAGRGRSSARRGTGRAAGGRAPARGRGGASCRPSSRRPCGRPPR